MKNKMVLTFLVFLFSTLSVTAQNKPEQKQTAESHSAVKVEAKDDSFSGKRVVRIEGLPIGENLTFSLKSTVDLNRKPNSFDRLLEYAEVTFISTTGKREYGSRSNRFDFLVDGVRVEGGEARSNPATDNLGVDQREKVIGSVDLNSLAKVVQGVNVQMKIGENVFSITAETTKHLKIFVSAVRQ